MKDISQLSKSFEQFSKRLLENMVEAQQHATEYMKEDALDRIEIPEEARNTSQFVAYANSLQMKDAELKANEISSSVFSDLLVGGDSKWADVPVGAFLEWGTGPLGENSNLFEHGYPYTTDEPWDMHTWLQFMQEGSWGIIARPHLFPAWLHAQTIFELNTKEAIEEAWTK